MPGYNGTGPLQQGPMTGGGRGYCIQPYQAKMGRFIRGGMRRGGIRRRGCWGDDSFIPQSDATIELEALSQQVTVLKEEVVRLSVKLAKYEEGEEL